jgi:hypothetical protein
MRLKSVFVLCAAIAVPGLAYAQRGGPPPSAPKPTKAEAQRLVELISGDKTKTQQYCVIGKLNEQMAQAEQIKDKKTLEMLARRADDLAHRIGHEYVRLMDGLDRIDENSSEGREIMAALDQLDRLCIR